MTSKKKLPVSAATCYPWWWQAGQGPAWLLTDMPRRYLAARTNSWGQRCSLMATMGATVSHDPAWASPRDIRRALACLGWTART